jgi:hypothetical protein
MGTEVDAHTFSVEKFCGFHRFRAENQFFSKQLNKGRHDF